MSAHAVYRMFNRDGGLLYVGCTSDLGARVDAHRTSKPWWVSVAEIKVTHFNTRDAALAHERQAIDTESPTYNRRTGHLPPMPAPDPAETLRAWGGVMAGFRRDRRLTRPALAAALSQTTGDTIDADLIGRWEAGAEAVPADLGVFIDDLLEAQGMLRRFIEEAAA